MTVNATAVNANLTQQEIDEEYDDYSVGLSHAEIDTCLRTLHNLPRPDRGALIQGFRAAIEGFLDTQAKQFEEDTYQKVLRYYLPECLDEALKQVVVERYLGVAIARPAEPETVSPRTRGASE
ncbi:MAG: hypothetical protein C0501_23775 [Isosphaera sp.]|nr:hypothetical protein [Isosphaera sp.]